MTCEEASPRQHPARQPGGDGDSKEHVQLLVKGAEDAFADIKASIGQIAWADISAENKEAIDKQLQAITDVITTAIVNDKELVAQQIGQSVLDIAAKTDILLKLKTAADAKDAKVNTCREAEKSVLNGTVGEMGDVVFLRDDKMAKCQARDTAQWLEWSAPPTGACDFEKDTFCDTFADVQEYIKLFKENIPNEYTDYHDKKLDCEAAVEALDAKLGEGTISQITDNSFMAKKVECDSMHADAATAMCSFGDRLQEKCASKSRYDLLVAGEGGKGDGTGLTLSQGDRQKCWTTVASIKCWFESFQKGTVDEAALDACKSSIDYSRDVGLVDDQAQDVEPLMAAESFSCQESNVTFSGIRWKTGGHPSDYVEESFVPSVVISPLGHYPFSFCDPADGTEVDKGPLP